MDLTTLSKKVEKRVGMEKGRWQKWSDSNGILINVGESESGGKWAFQVFKQGKGHVVNSGPKFPTADQAGQAALQWVKSQGTKLADKKTPVEGVDGHRPIADGDEGDYSGKEEKMAADKGEHVKEQPSAFKSEFHQDAKHPMAAAYEEHEAKAKLAKALSGSVDEAIWKKAKDASQEAFGKIKWPFVNWWYQHHGGK